MSPVVRTVLLTVLWVASLLAAILVLAVGVVSLSDAALRVAFAVIGLAALLASLLLFQAPQPATPVGESRANAVRATSELRASLR